MPTEHKLKHLLELASSKTANFKLQGERKFRGLDIAIENEKGSVRRWYDPAGKEAGHTVMVWPYGYIRLTEGTDGDHVDVYLGPDEDAENVFIVDQMRKPDFKTFDEQKVMLGFKSAADAKAAYLRQYNDPRFFGSMKAMPFEEFKMKVLSRKNHGEKIASMGKQALTLQEMGILHALGVGTGAAAGAYADKDDRIGGALRGAAGGAVGPLGMLGAEWLASGTVASSFAAPLTGALSGYAAGRLGTKKVAFAVTPGMLSGLQHAGVGAGIGALAGGVGGAMHANPDHRGQGIVRGALVGAGLGAAGGAGIAAIKGHGAQQLATLRGSAQEAEQAAVKAHMNIRGVAPTELNMPAAAPRVRNPLDPNNTKQFAVRPLTLGAPDVHPRVDPVISTAQHQASAAGAKATALSQAANTLEGQQAVMNRGINRAGLVGAAAGTGLMGYTAVPKEYGGVGQKAAADVDALAAEIQRMKAEKALDDRVGKYDAALDSFGIGALAAPYVAESLGHGLTWAGDKIMPRSTRLGAGLATAGNFLERGAKSMHHSNLRELGGLALVTPMVTHPIAHALAKRSPQPAAPLAAPPMPAMQTAEKIGRLLAQPREKVAISVMGAVRGAANFAWQNKKPLAGIAAVGAVGAGLYGAKKGIDTAANLAQPHHAARFVGAPPGQQVMGNSAYQPLG